MAIGRRLVSRRILLSIVFVLLVFFLLKFYVDSSSGFVKSSHLDASGHRTLVDLVVVEEHHEGKVKVILGSELYIQGYRYYRS